MRLPPNEPLPPSLRRELDGLRRDIEQLWRRVPQKPDPPRKPNEVLWSFIGTPAANDPSPPYWVAENGTAVRMVVTGKSGEGINEVALYVNGTERHRMTFDPALGPKVDRNLLVEVMENDRLTVAFTQVVDIQNPVVQVMIREQAEQQ